MCKLTTREEPRIASRLSTIPSRHPMQQCRACHGMRCIIHVWKRRAALCRPAGLMSGLTTVGQTTHDDRKTMIARRTAEAARALPASRAVSRPSSRALYPPSVATFLYRSRISPKAMKECETVVARKRMSCPANRPGGSVRSY